MLRRRDGFSMFGVIAVVIVVGGYMMFPGMYHTAAQTAVNTVFDALHSAFGGDKQRPLGGTGLERPPRVPGDKAGDATKSRTAPSAKTKAATRTTAPRAKVNSET